LGEKTLRNFKREKGEEGKNNRFRGTVIAGSKCVRKSFRGNEASEKKKKKEEMLIITVPKDLRK